MVQVLARAGRVRGAGDATTDRSEKLCAAAHFATVADAGPACTLLNGTGARDELLWRGCDVLSAYPVPIAERVAGVEFKTRI